MCARSSTWIEHCRPKARVVGSNPIGRVKDFHPKKFDNFLSAQKSEIFGDIQNLHFEVFKSYRARKKLSIQ